MSSGTAPAGWPVYLINLDRDVDRLAAMTGHLQALGLPMQRIPAVYGRTLPADERARLYDPAANARHHHHPLVDGEIGCYASHLRLWQRIADEGHAHALVLEDDVVPMPRLLPLLEAVARLPGGWDMIKLIGRDHERPWQRLALGPDADLIRYHRVPSLTSAYLISAAGVRRLLAQRPPFFRPIDIDIRHWWEFDLRVFGTLPYPVRHADAAAASSIGQREREGGARHRWAKIRLQALYSVQAWSANRRLAREQQGRIRLEPDALEAAAR